MRLDRKNPIERLPLFGHRILITRPHEQAGELVQALRALGAETIALPTIAIANPEDWTPLDRALRQLPRYDWIIFTSANGVRKFVERLAAREGDIRELAGAKLCAIGPATAEELRKHLLRVDKVPDEYVAEGVVRAFAGVPLKNKRVLIPRARVARDLLPEALRQRGAQVDVVEAYRTILPPESVERARHLFEDHPPTMAIFTSSSTVKNLFRLLPGNELLERMREMKIASIGPVTTRTLAEYGLTVHIEARQYTIPSLVEAIQNYVGSATQK